jgi:hypothetical protein
LLALRARFVDRRKKIRKRACPRGARDGGTTSGCSRRRRASVGRLLSDFQAGEGAESVPSIGVAVRPQRHHMDARRGVSRKKDAKSLEVTASLRKVATPPTTPLGCGARPSPAGPTPCRCRGRSHLAHCTATAYPSPGRTSAPVAGMLPGAGRFGTRRSIAALQTCSPATMARPSRPAVISR